MAMDPRKCRFTDRINKGTCKRCNEKFKMGKHEYCCLDLCGELDGCRDCKGGTRSEEYKEWSKTYANRI